MCNLLVVVIAPLHVSSPFFVAIWIQTGEPVVLLRRQLVTTSTFSGLLRSVVYPSHWLGSCYRRHEHYQSQFEN